MIRMILADDESVITRGIQKLLDWKMLGIEITGEYTDGRRAFEAIIKEKPDIALLDISMPGMSGVDILKECRAMEDDIIIIFISGFQDFEYAKAALEYGAAAYLLKPVIREELLKAIEKSIRMINGEEILMGESLKKNVPCDRIDYGCLIEDCDICYVPIYADIVYHKDEEAHMKRLVHFSLFGFLEEYLGETGLGIVFQKNDNIVIVLKEKKAGDARRIVEEILAKSSKATKHTAFFVIGDAVCSMSEIPSMFEKCLERSGYVFFADEMPVPVITLHEKVFTGPGDSEMLGELRSKLFDAVVTQNEGQLRKIGSQYGKVVLRLAEGKKEDVCFYFCTAVRFMEERCDALDLTGRKLEMKNLLERSRECINFAEIEEMFAQEFVQYLEILRETAGSRDRQDILKAKDYIEKHYMENLSLNVLAEEIHMNPYYFSSFFKKNTGENFKEYVNRIRIEHAVPMLLSPDLKTYEIAEKVGFSDIRMFNAAFMKIYKEMPGSYRKRMRKNC